ncbi:Chimaerin and related Rho GTPase activating proteins [Phaffia rhodozyma]|uniref:Chimaerin and related Rho GTPase activating proteins n=1 Tax=Phaffia rhodozyma TaxID=264483 RepID=A0A0F7ST15_PHARH|nr:Chimaerin and related Rho GTPase activating proteins [Phaffia rhodozyma]
MDQQQQKPNRSYSHTSQSSVTSPSGQSNTSHSHSQSTSSNRGNGSFSQSDSYNSESPSYQQQQQHTSNSLSESPSISDTLLSPPTASSSVAQMDPSTHQPYRPSISSTFNSNFTSSTYSENARPSLETRGSSSSVVSLKTSINVVGVGHPSAWPEMGDGLGLGVNSGVGGSGQGQGVPVQFDEGVLRQLCDLDCALPLLTERIKQSLASCKQTSTFLKSRARIEETYARSLGELGRDLMDQYSRSEGKAGSFLKAYNDTLRVNDLIAQQRLKYAAKLNEMGEELVSLGKEIEKARKQHKETGSRYERQLQDADLAMEKAKTRFDVNVEELERILILKEGGTMKDAGMHNASNSNGHSSEGRKKLGKAMIGKGAGLFKGKNPAQMQRQEDETRQRMSQTSDAFRKAVLDAQSIRQEYFNSQLPKILRLLKQCADELDLATQYHLSRYAFLAESVTLQEGMTLSPIDSTDAGPPGLKAIAETIDNRTDFKTFMTNFVVARGGVPRGPRREGLYEEGYQPALPPHVQHSQTQVVQDEGAKSGKQIFGFDLTEAMLRDGDEVPKILVMCTEAIESKGLTSVGIYRLSGMTSSVQKLKSAFDRDVDLVDLENDDAYADINVVSSALKLWFRELPDPLFTYSLYSNFMEAAKIENDRLRHIRLHEQVNELPDASYAALKFFMAHLHKVRSHEKVNQMSASNLAIVFGPTLFRQPPEGGGGDGMSMQDLMSFQCRAVETILLKYEEIFV